MKTKKILSVGLLAVCSYDLLPKSLVENLKGTMINIDREKCVACGACVRDCIVHVLTAGADGVPTVTSSLPSIRSCTNQG